MAETITSGIVVKKRNYNEFDQIVTLITQGGYVSFIAMGVRKMSSKNRVALDIGNIIEIEYFKARLVNKLSKLKRATLLKQPPTQIDDTGAIILEIIKQVNRIKNPSSKIYNDILLSYPWFGKGVNQKIRTFLFFSTLSEFGVHPITSACVECGKNNNISDFKLYKGGFLCQEHSKGREKLEILKGWQSLAIGLEHYINIDITVDAYIYKHLKSYLLALN